MTIITYPRCNFQHGAYIEEFDTLSCDLVHSCSNTETESPSDNDLCLSVVKGKKLRCGKGLQISFFLKCIQKHIKVRGSPLKEQSGRTRCIRPAGKVCSAYSIRCVSAFKNIAPVYADLHVIAEAHLQDPGLNQDLSGNNIKAFNKFINPVHPLGSVLNYYNINRGDRNKIRV